jgi:hypothetical protein
VHYATGRVEVGYDPAVTGPEAFAEAWHGRVRAALTDDSLFAVEPIDT